MSKSFVALVGALAAVTAVAWAGAANAETSGAMAAGLGSGYTADDAPLGSPVELRIDLQGRIAAHCDLISPPNGMKALRFNHAGQDSAGFSIDCNAPFSLRVVSQHGGFASVDPTPGIKSLIPYELSVAVGTDSGPRNLGWCMSSALTATAAGGCDFAPNSPGRGWSSGDDTAIRQTGSLAVRWNGQAEGAPLLGAYGDTIVIQLQVRS